jgi:hypothetical protein
MATKKKSPKKKAASKKKAAPKKKAAAKSLTVKLTAVKAVEVKVKYLKKLYKFSEARPTDIIHVRKTLPKIKAGAKMRDMVPTAAMAFGQDMAVGKRRGAAMGVAPMAPTDTISLFKNVQLNDVATQDTASHVCEPSTAVNGLVVFYTGNWFAAVSTNGGTSFLYVNPYNTFPNPPGMVFCCDQVVHYVKSIDTFVWLLQYGKDGTGKNIQRIAYATTAKVKTGNWKYFDITPASLGLAAGTWLDFPDLSTSTNKLYMTSNNFNSAGAWQASVVARISLTSFTTGVLSATSYKSTSFSSFRVAQNCGTTAYFVAHKSNSALRVFTWPEASAAPTTNDVSVASWASSGYSSITPDNKNWLSRADGRHTGATLAGNELWFAWGSAKGGANNRPQAFVQIARINATTKALLENINLWSATSATFYAGLSTNSNGEVGASFAMGGGPLFPQHVVGILTGTRRQVVTFAGSRGPSDNKWGDYLTVRRNYPKEKQFVATGYVLKNGAGNSDATPNFTVFGRSSDI